MYGRECQQDPKHEKDSTRFCYRDPHVKHEKEYGHFLEAKKWPLLTVIKETTISILQAQETKFGQKAESSYKSSDVPQGNAALSTA